VRSDRWEHGSDFHLSLEAGPAEVPWGGRPHSLWGSGRDAIRAVLALGSEELGWRRVLCPTFFCQNVVAALARQLEVALYEDDPVHGFPASFDTRPGDVLFVPNVYGARRKPRVCPGGSGIPTIEDHTHDPLSAWAYESDADYAIASLRKTLPLPDGGVVWSPTSRPLPPERPMTPAHARASLDRLSAMVLKSHYLAGDSVSKEEFRECAVDGERAIGGGEISGISPFSRARMGSLPTRTWREARVANLAAFREALGVCEGVTLLEAPFAATLLFDSAAAREKVRKELVAVQVYPAVLWSLDDPVVPEIPAPQIDLARRLLTVHCDYRYSPADMARVAAEVLRAHRGKPRTR